MSGYGMGAGGLLWMLIVGAIIVVPFWRLLPRYGVPNWVGLIAVFPLAAIVLLYVMAFREELGGKGGAA